MERFITGSIAVEIGETDASEAATQLLNPRIKSTEFRPTLSALSFDIETDMKAEQLYSIGVYSVQESVVFMLGDAAWREKLAGSADVIQNSAENSSSAPRKSNKENSALRIEVLSSERAVITAFLDHVARVDPDVLIGWNVVNFDLRCLQREHVSSCCGAAALNGYNRSKLCGRAILGRSGHTGHAGDYSHKVDGAVVR